MIKIKNATFICMFFISEKAIFGCVFASQVYTLNDIPSSINQQHEELDTPLFLAVKINSSPSQTLTSVKYSKKDKTFSIKGVDFKSLRLHFHGVPEDNSWVNINKLPGVKVTYMPENQELYLNVSQSNLVAYEISLNSGANVNDSLLKTSALTSTVVNYNLYNMTSNNRNYVSASAEGLINTNYGNFSTSWIYNNKSFYGIKGLLRLDTYWQYIDPEKIRSYTVGDLVTNTVNWGSSVRVAGVQWSSAYSQRSDLVTTALPQFSGSAAVPSSLDLFVDQQKVYSGEIPSGPFDIKMLPFVSGNEVTIVTKDVNGQQRSSTRSYYYSPYILRKGINEFSVDVGFPRFNYASRSSDYNYKILFASVSSRRGLTDTTTLTLNTQSSTNGLTNIGAGISQTLFGRGVVSFAVAGSHFKQQSGMLGQISLDGRLSKHITFNSSYQKSGTGYSDLGRVANFIYQNKYQHRFSDQSSSLTYTSQSNEIIRAGINYSPIPSWSFGTYFNHLVYSDSRYNLVSLNANTGIIPNLNISANLYKDLSGKDSGGYIVLTYNFSNKYNLSSSFNRDNGRTGYTQQINSIADSGINTLSWGASTTHYSGDSATTQLYGNYRGRYGTYNASLQQYGNQTQTTFSASGAIVVADQSVFPTNTVGQSFALVKNAGPGTHILNGGVDLGAADNSGHFLITDMTPYIENHIFLDTTHLPLDWQTKDTEKIAVSGYRQGSLINFKSEKVISATIVLLDKTHHTLPPGYKVILNNDEESFTGYGGEVYFEHLKARNTLSVDLLDKGSCHAQFDYNLHRASNIKIGPYLCQ